MKITKKFIEFDGRLFFLLLVLFYAGVAFMTNTFLLTHDFYANYLGGQVSNEKIEDFIQITVKLRIIAYILIPVTLAIKLFIIAGGIYGGVILFNYTIEFSKILKLVMLAEVVMVLSAFFKLTYFMFFGISDYTVLRTFYPLSICNIINVKNIPAYLISALQIVNLFEILYWIILIAGISRYSAKSLYDSFKLVASTYGVTILIWQLSVIFFQLQFG